MTRFKFPTAELFFTALVHSVASWRIYGYSVAERNMIYEHTRGNVAYGLAAFSLNFQRRRKVLVQRGRTLSDQLRMGGKGIWKNSKQPESCCIAQSAAKE